MKPETRPLRFPWITLFMVALVLQAAYYQIAMYGLTKKANLSKEIYLTCLHGSVVPVLSNGKMPSVRTDNGKMIACSGNMV